MAKNKLPRLTPEQAQRIATMDKRKAAIHEAGHALVAAGLGAFGQVEVIPNDSPRAGLGEYFWHGSFTRPPRMVLEVLDDGEISLRDFHLQTLDAFGEAVLGIAGVVAEHIARATEQRQTVGPDRVAEEICEYLEGGGLAELSGTDSAPLFACRDLLRVATHAAKILLDQHALHDRLVAELIEGNYLSDGQVESLIREMWHGPPPEVWPPPVDHGSLMQESLTKRIARGDTEAVTMLAALDENEVRQSA